MIFCDIKRKVLIVGNYGMGYFDWMDMGGKVDNSGLGLVFGFLVVGWLGKFFGIYFY